MSIDSQHARSNQGVTQPSGSSETASALASSAKRKEEEDGEGRHQDGAEEDSAERRLLDSQQRRIAKKRGPRQAVCIRCRASKLRCDRQLPCLHCKKRDLQCEYPKGHELALLAHVRPEVELDVAAQKRRKAPQRYDSSLSASQEAARSRSSSSSSSSSSSISDTSKGQIVVHRISPQPEQAFFLRPGWQDHLFSLFDTTRWRAQRLIIGLLHRIPQMMYKDHLFHMIHMELPIRAIAQPDKRSSVHPALVYAFVALALRMLNRNDEEQLIPVEGVPSPARDDDVTIRLQQEAEILLAQSLSDESFGPEHLLAIGQAAAMIMKLQSEMTASHSYYYNVVARIVLSPTFRHLTDNLSSELQGVTFTGSLLQRYNESFSHRNNIRAEEAARLRLITLWTSFRQGFVFPNVEVLRGRFRMQEVQNATVFAPFLDEVRETGARLRYDISADDSTGLMYSVGFRARALNMVSQCASSWEIGQLDYVTPSQGFDRFLHLINEGDMTIRALKQGMAARPNPTILQRRYFAKRIVAACFLQGFLIRRIGVAHCAALRPDVVRSLQRQQAGVEMDADADSEVPYRNGPPPWEKPFDSPSLAAWLHLMHSFMAEIDAHHRAHDQTQASSPGAPSAPSPALSHFSLDSLLLYAAATSQYAQGVAQVYRILGHPDPMRYPLATALFDAARRLRAKVAAYRETLIRLGHLPVKPPPMDV